MLQMVAAFEAACGRPLPYRIEPRRPGDIAESAGPIPPRPLGNWTGTPAGIRRHVRRQLALAVRQPQWLRGVGPGLRLRMYSTHTLE